MAPKTNTILAISIFLLYALFLFKPISTGLSSVPHEGDSLYYHIPLAQSLLKDNFFQADYDSNYHMYFPGANELILATLITTGIPLNIYNILATFALGFILYKLALQYQLTRTTSLTYSLSIISLQLVTRWLNTQIVDIWLAAFFTATLWFLRQKPSSRFFYLILGVFSGFLIGGKLTGPAFFILLVFFFWPRIKTFSPSNLLIFSFPPSAVIGLSWYLRNWNIHANPVYPLDTPIFAGISQNPIIQTQVWHTLRHQPMSLINAFISEYMLWSILMIIPVFLSFLIIIPAASRAFRRVKTDTKTVSGIFPSILRLTLLGLANFLIFLFLPSGDSYQLHVSQFRFSLPALIPLALAVFLIAKRYRLLAQLQVIVLLNLLLHFLPSYHPKLILIPSIIYSVIS